MVPSFLRVKAKLLGVWFPYHCWVFISYFPPHSLHPATLTTLLFLEHEGHAPVLGMLPLLSTFLKQTTFQISSQLVPSCLSSICSNVTFSWNPSLTTLRKSTTASFCTSTPDAPSLTYFSPYTALPLFTFSIIYLCFVACLLPLECKQNVDRDVDCSFHDSIPRA